MSPFTLYVSNATISGVKQIFQWSPNYKFQVQIFSILTHVNKKITIFQLNENVEVWVCIIFLLVLISV